MPTTTCSGGEIINAFNTPCVFAQELLSIQSVDDCGCFTCKAELNLQATFFIDAFEFLSGEFISGAQGEIENCDQTEVVLGPFEFAPFENDFSADCNEIIVDYLNSLELTATLTFDPCVCGACCDGEACEDNVAENGCGAWVGEGTSCIDDPPPCEEE